MGKLRFQLAYQRLISGTGRKDVALHIRHQCAARLAVGKMRQLLNQSLGM